VEVSSLVRLIHRPTSSLDARNRTVLTTNNSHFHPESGQRIRCVIADDHALLRYGVRRLLEDDSDFVVVGEASDAAEALKLVLEERPNLVLLDIAMEGMSSFEAGRLIGEHCPGARVVYLTMHEDPDYVAQAFRSGASGYLLKDTPAPRLLHALREIHRGERVLSPQVVAQFKDEGIGNERARVALRRNTLTLREREVMKLLAEGNTVRKAAGILGVSAKTVEAHKFNLMRKLDIHNKAQLVTTAIQKKILRMPVTQ
jgi:DNA-binding NarL/FixJ family response regulator